MKKSDDLKKAISRRKHLRKKHAKRTGCAVEFLEGTLVFASSGKPATNPAISVPKS